MKLPDEKLLEMHLPKEMVKKVKDKEFSGMVIARALISEKIFKKAMQGNLKAMEMFLRINGLDQEQMEVDSEVTITRRFVTAPQAQQGASNEQVIPLVGSPGEAP